MDLYERKKLLEKNSNYYLTFLNEFDLRKELENWCRQDLINWLKWNDPNGVYDDEESINELGNIMSFDEGVEIIINQITC